MKSIMLFLTMAVLISGCGGPSHIEENEVTRTTEMCGVEFIVTQVPNSTREIFYSEEYVAPYTGATPFTPANDWPEPTFVVSNELYRYDYGFYGTEDCYAMVQ